MSVSNYFLHTVPNYIFSPESGLFREYSLLTPTRGILLSSACWALIYLPCIALSFFSRSFRTLPRSTKVEWVSRVVSNIHAILTMILAYISVFWGPDWHWMAKVTLMIGGGYFVTDSLVILTNIKTISMPIPSLFHHMFLFTSAVYAMKTHPFLAIWGTGAYVSEGSTPFVNARWFASFRHNKSPIYVVVGISMVITFFIFRIIYFPYLSWFLINQVEYLTPKDTTPVVDLIKFGHTGGICTAVIYSLNLYWFSLMLKGAYKMLVKKSDPHDVIKSESAVKLMKEDTSSTISNPQKAKEN